MCPGSKRAPASGAVPPRGRNSDPLLLSGETALILQGCAAGTGQTLTFRSESSGGFP